MAISKTQVDRLGDRLRQGPVGEADIRMLDEHRRSYGDAYESVVRVIRERLHLDPTGRPAKSTGSIIEKLRRESIRLSQMQDIAGCRIVVTDVPEQDAVVSSLQSDFPGSMIVDRRLAPSYGYRAVHMIVPEAGRLIEVQIRSRLQQFWAELSEKLSDVFDPAIKYGGGAENVRRLLDGVSNSVARYENLEARLGSGLGQLALTGLREEFEQLLIDLIAAIERQGGRNDDLPN